jgi:cytochrome P450
MTERRNQKIDKGDFIGRLNDMLKNLEKPLSEEMVVAQGVIFFAAGFETTASTLSTLSYHLATNPEIQERIHNEIQEAMDASDGKINQVFRTLKQIFIQRSFKERFTCK